MASKPPVASTMPASLPFHLHAEWIRNLAIGSPEIPFSRLEATRDRIKEVLPDADVGNHQILIPNLSLPVPMIVMF